jgi:hypothetical protein
MYNLNGTDSGIPVGFGLALAQNSNALALFAGMTEEERQRIIEKTHGIESKKEMRSFVEQLIIG